MTKSPAKQEAAKSRAERLKQALKANLKRRKAQDRVCTAAPGTKDKQG